MADLLALFGTDITRETEGVWNTLAPGVRVKIARWDNPRMQRALEREMEPFRDQIDAGTLDPDDDRKIIANVMAEAIVMDWEGVEVDGEEIPCKKEDVAKVLADPRLRDFMAQIQLRAKQAEKYRLKATESDAKNSPRRSGGS